MPGEERRRKTRTVKSGTQTVYLTYMSGPGQEKTIAAKLIDLTEEGCGLRTEVIFHPGTLIRVTGDFRNSGVDLVMEGKVAWCRPTAGTPRTFMTGVAFAKPLGGSIPREEAGASEGASTKRKAQPTSKPELGADDRPDHYETLQLSPNADHDTIHRVYRLMAHRYHPDNQETGNQGMFRKVLEAFNTLSDPEKRAAYDVDYRAMKKLQWRIFDQTSATVGLDGEKAKRRGVVSLLYTKRRTVPESPTMSLVELEEILAVPRDHLEFTLWYLREAGFVSRSDNARFQITFKGVDHAEESGSWAPRPDRLLESSEAIKRRTATN